MRATTQLLAAALTVSSLAVFATAQGLNPAEISKPLGDSWPTYSGDYSGKRYSSLTQINQENVKHLTLAWAAKITPGTGGGGGGRGGTGAPVIVGGEGTGAATGGGFGGATNVRASILEVNGVLYFTLPDNAWAVDARDGHEIWHYFWKTK